MPRLILLGLRASGKSTLGRLAAAQLGATFIDLDDCTARLLAQPSAGEAIRLLGLPAFRAGEVRALSLPEVANAGVLSLGGGTPTDPAARAALARFQQSGSIIVYLRATPETLRARLARTDLSTRPTLTGAGPLAEVDQIFRERDPIFRSVANTSLDVDTFDEQSALKSVLSLLRPPSSP